MKELDDKDFDQIFKNRIKEGYLEYEEESWLKMEKKLRKRDRFVFYRNASILLVFLSVGIGIYLMADKKMPAGDVKSVKKAERKIEGEIKKSSDLPSTNEYLADNTSKMASSISKDKKEGSLSSKNAVFSSNPQTSPKTETVNTNQTIATNNYTIGQNQVVAQDPILTQSSSFTPTSAPKNQELVETLIDEKINLPRKPKPISLSINVGPDFNSTENAIGGKSGMAIGIGVNVPISSKLSVQTGINYGSKNYEAKGYDYTFNNPNTMYLITGIDASCKVLEIPLRASYTIGGNHKNSININAGLSSYIMLKENYRFIYTAASGRKDRFLEEKNANQHYLSVIDLSATYNIKLKNKKFALGLEPYVKIPISGIGEGSVPLKSSGISLKINYELSKKK
ncbi:MAG: outer membrane beta-barrel protein [Bacteroidota bacterium]